MGLFERLKRRTKGIEKTNDKLQKCREDCTEHIRLLQEMGTHHRIDEEIARVRKLMEEIEEKSKDSYYEDEVANLILTLHPATLNKKRALVKSNIELEEPRDEITVSYDSPEMQQLLGRLMELQKQSRTIPGIPCSDDDYEKKDKKTLPSSDIDRFGYRTKKTPEEEAIEGLQGRAPDSGKDDRGEDDNGEEIDLDDLYDL